MTGDVAQWWLVRHAPTVNPDRIVYGALDLDILPPDPAEIAALAALLPDDPVWIVSHLSRTRATLDAISNARGRAPGTVHVEPDFGEQHFGDWEGRPGAEIWAGLQAEDTSWPADIRPPGGESFSDVAARVSAAARSWSDRLRGRPVVAVIHAGSIRGFLAAAMGGPPVGALSYVVDPLSVTRCDNFAADSWRIGYVNRAASLPAPPR